MDTQTTVAGERVIRGPACIAEGADHLAATEPAFARALARTGPLPMRLRDDGFTALLSAIVSQQVSVAAADAIWAKVEAAGMTDPARIAAADDDTLRACGLSRQKARYARALALADLPYAKLRTRPSEDVVTTLTAVPGIGRWTAEIYTMFSLGRADIFAPGDLALQEATRLLFELDVRPTERIMREMSHDWSPWRGVAARLLWAYYHVEKEREGIR